MGTETAKIGTVWDRLLKALYPVSGVPHVTAKNVILKHLPQSLTGLKIVQLSDLHIDFWNLPAVESAVEQCNRLQADLVVMTGDFISHGSRYLSHLESLLGTLQARHGVYACMGNHDYSDGDQGKGVLRALSQANVHILVNENTTLQINGTNLALAGVDDFLKGRPNLDNAIKGLNTDVPTLCLAHNPRHFTPWNQTLEQPGLMFSGHTHGGQIRMPGTTHLMPWLCQSNFLAGHYQQNDSHLYVSRGVGSAIYIQKRYQWHIPTVRFNVQPEVALITLNAESK